MKITQIRNATLIIEYNNNKFLIDPWLGPKNYMPGFDSAINAQIRQPRVELPFAINEIVNVDAVIVTHVHTDNWDEFAEKALDKNKNAMRRLWSTYWSLILFGRLTMSRWWKH